MTGWIRTRKAVICEKWRETQLKLVHRAIYAFNITNTRNTESWINKFPKCDLLKADLDHGMWLCPKTRQYWEWLLSWIKDTWHIDLPCEPEVVLFHVFPDTIQVPKLIDGVLLVALKCLLQKWLEPQTPTGTEFHSLMRHFLLMDQLDAESNKNRGSAAFLNKWSKFLAKHLSTEETQALMSNFKHTEWYLQKDIRGTLGKLKVS